MLTLVLPAARPILRTRGGGFAMSDALDDLTRGSRRRAAGHRRRAARCRARRLTEQIEHGRPARGAPAAGHRAGVQRGAAALSRHRAQGVDVTGAGRCPRRRPAPRGPGRRASNGWMLAPTGPSRVRAACRDDLRALHDQISESYFAPGRDLLGPAWRGWPRCCRRTVAGRFAEKFLPPDPGARAAEMSSRRRRATCAERCRCATWPSSLASRPGALYGPSCGPFRRNGSARWAAELFRRHEYGAVAELAGGVTREALRRRRRGRDRP